MSSPNAGYGGPMEWIATPPGGLRRPRRPRPARAYTGPPSYPAVPRWGFPLLGWRWPLALPAKPEVDPVRRVAATAHTATSTLWITAGVGALAFLAEGWRYVLLLLSLNGALSRTTLAISDALVSTVGILSWLLGVLSGLLVVLWALRARSVAAERIGIRHARSDWHVIAGTLIPGLNLSVPGSVLAELEHAVLVGEGFRERHARPRPSRLVVIWWAAWVICLLLGWTAFLWGFRSGVQAQADGVVLHMWNDLAVTVLAITTIRVIGYLTRLMVPLDPADLPALRVLAVRNAPDPGRAPRPAQASR